MLLEKVNTVSKVSSVKGAIWIISIDQFTMLAIRRLMKSVLESLLYYFKFLYKSSPQQTRTRSVKVKKFCSTARNVKGDEGCLTVILQKEVIHPYRHYLPHKTTKWKP